jgi:Ca-activated chloride channel family protein
VTFGAPGYLLFLLLVPLAAAILVAWTLWRREARARFGGVSAPSGVALLSGALLLAGLALAVVAASRPQFGNRQETVEDRGIDLVIVFDVSQSMVATDVEPTRIGRAQQELLALLDRLRGDRVGLVIFGANPFPRSPLTSDLQALRRIIEGVDRERGLVLPGSDLGAAIRRGREVVATGRAETKAMLIVSDGEDHGERVETSIADVVRTGVRVYAAGVGTDAGAPVLDVDDAGVPRPRIAPSGEPVVTRLNRDALRGIAAAGDGRYIELAGDARQLPELAGELAALERTTFATEDATHKVERFQVFTVAALATVLAGTALAARAPSLWRARRLWPLVAGGLLVGSVCATDAADLNRTGNARYAAGEYTGAVTAYRTAEALAPRRGELHHNAGNALHQAGRLEEAVEESQRALPADDEALEAAIEYALGNHHAAAAQLDEAIEAYKRALLAQPSDADAKHNLEVLTTRRVATPTATSTPVVPDIQPTPDDGDGDGRGGEGTATPVAGQTASPDDSPLATPSSGEGEPSAQEIQRLLADALRGIDEEFTVEEALRVLELLEEQNRAELDEQRRDFPGTRPDY